MSSINGLSTSCQSSVPHLVLHTFVRNVKQTGLSEGGVANGHPKTSPGDTLTAAGSCVVERCGAATF